MAIAALEERVTDYAEVGTVRAAAVGALVRIGDESARSVILDARRDPDPLVRREGCAARSVLEVPPEAQAVGDRSESTPLPDRYRSMAFLGWSNDQISKAVLAVTKQYLLVRDTEAARGSSRGWLFAFSMGGRNASCLSENVVVNVDRRFRPGLAVVRVQASGDPCGQGDVGLDIIVGIERYLGAESREASTTLTPAQQAGLAELEAFVDTAACVYQVPPPAVTVVDNDVLPGAGAGYQRGVIAFTKRVLTSPSRDMIIAHELGHYFLRHKLSWEEIEHEANIEAVRILQVVKGVKGMSEEVALRAVVRALDSYHRAVKAGSPLGRGHTHPCEEIRRVVAAYPSQRAWTAALECAPAQWIGDEKDRGQPQGHLVDAGR